MRLSGSGALARARLVVGSRVHEVLVAPVTLVLLGGSACVAPDEPCAVNRVPLLWTTPGDSASGELGGMLVPVEHEGRSGYLAIDTGSGLTFLYLGEDGPEYVPEAGTVRIGCETLSLPGRSFGADDPSGLGILGVLGADFFLTVTTDFDPAAGTITRYPGGGGPQGTEGWTALPYEDVQHHCLLRLTVDGVPLRLMWDTGSPHLLWVGAEGRPGDEPSLAQDVEGGRFPMFAGPGQLEIPGLAHESRPVPVILRAPRFPYFEGTVEALGGDLQGLAGQSVFGWRRLVFEPAARVLRVGPLPER